jgi:stearoyl-CoA desaturase (delta-9 desaturase)
MIDLSKKYYMVLQVPIYLTACIILLPYISWTYIIIGLVFAYSIMVVSQEAGGHRYFSHNSFKLSDNWERFIYFTMIVAANGSPLDWRSSHLDHHQHSDTDKDPTSPKRFGILGIYSNYWKLIYEPQNTALKSLAWVSRNKPAWIDYHKNYFRYVVSFQALMLATSMWIGYEWFIVTVMIPVSMSNIILNTISAYCHTREYRNDTQKHRALDNKYVNIISPGAGMHAEHHNMPGIYRASGVDVTATVIDLIKRK